MHLYVFRRGTESTDELVERCLRHYSAEKGIEISDARIERSSTGKPYFAGPFGVYFSVSHSADICACLMSDVKVGIDIQEERDVRADGLAERFMTAEDLSYTEKNGSEGFFDIWTAKEASLKLFGMKLIEGLSGIDVTDGDRLLDEIQFRGKRIRIARPDTGTGMRCACAYETCAHEKTREEKEIRIIRWI